MHRCLELATLAGVVSGWQEEEQRSTVLVARLAVDGREQDMETGSLTSRARGSMLYHSHAGAMSCSRVGEKNTLADFKNLRAMGLGCLMTVGQDHSMRAKSTEAISSILRCLQLRRSALRAPALNCSKKE
jgi:hypothetical protein